MECLHCKNCKVKEMHENIEECYKYTIEQVELLYNLTKKSLIKTGVCIDIFVTGTVRNTITKLFFDLSQSDLHLKIKPPNKEEVIWIEGSTQGALNYKCTNKFKIVQKENKDTIKGYKYDYNSFYPSILQSTNSFPISEGEFKILDKFENQYGIYRVFLLNKEKLPNFKHIRDDKEYYTHTDLLELQKLNIKFELIQDGKYNALLYDENTRMKGNQLFKKYVDYLYKIKKENKECKYAKVLLNNLWGIFSQKNIISFYFPKKKEGIFTCDDAIDIKTLYNSNSDIIGYEYGNLNNYYKGILPRIKPFLLSIGRKKIYNLSNDYYKNNQLLAVFTDSVILTQPIENFINSDKLGELKFEGEVLTQMF